MHRLTCVVALALVLVLVGAAPGLAQPRRCAQHMVVGTYALAVQGSTLMTLPGQSLPASLPFASLAIVSIDGEGVMTGIGKAALAGRVGESVVSGHIHVNADCTADVTTGVGTASTDVIVDNGEELIGLMIEFPAGKPALMGTARRISRAPLSVDGPCRPHRPHGLYAVSYQGSYMIPLPGVPQPVPMPALMIGLVSVEHSGHVTGHGTASITGQSMPYDIVDGQLDMDEGCTAVVEMKVDSGGIVDTGKSWMVSFRDGDEFWAIQTESHTVLPVVAGKWKRVSFGGEHEGGSDRY